MAKLLAFVCALLAAGCAEAFYSGDATVDQLKARAAFDLDCPKSKIKTTTIDDRTRGVSGCGQRVTYVENCEKVGRYGEVDNCTWVLNTDARRHKKSDDDDDDE